MKKDISLLEISFSLSCTIIYNIFLYAYIFYGKREEGGCPMKEYFVFLIQMLIWSGFSFIEWLSGRDRPFFRGMLLCIFLYIAFLLARKMGLRTRKALITTMVTVIVYFSCQHFVWKMLHFQ
jgi:hypothetical protein